MSNGDTGVSRRGDNLPAFAARQLEFAAHIRNPEVHPVPADVDPRRMQIYVELFSNNVESFLAGTFPVAKSVLSDERWHSLAREFLRGHASASPYFLEISQQFLTFLGNRGIDDLPAFFIELCHYEWVELALGAAEEEIAEDGVDPGGDLETGVPVVSPLIWPLAYRYPVHRIGPDFVPEAPSAQPTQLVVYRTTDDRVRFMEVNALTMALLTALETGNVSGADVLGSVAEQVSGLDPLEIRRQGLAALQRLRGAGIILGTAVLAP